MNDYVQVRCVECSRALRVRMEYIGHQVACNHCGHSFLATSRDPRALRFLLQRTGAVAAETLLPDETKTVADDATLALDDPSHATDDHLVEPSRSDSAAVDKRFDQEQRILKREIEQLRLQVAASRAELVTARDKLETLEQARDRLDADCVAIDRLRRDAESRENQRHAELDAVQARSAAEQQHYEQELQRLERQVDEQRQRLEGEIERLTALSAERQRECETLLERADTLHNERDHALAALGRIERAQEDAARAWCDDRTRLAETLEQARREQEASASQSRDFEYELAALRSEIAVQRERSVRQNEALAALGREIGLARRETERLVTTLVEERSRAAANAHEWQEKLASLERQLDREREALAGQLEQQAAASQREREQVLHERDRAITERDLSNRDRQKIEEQWQATLTQLNQAIAESHRQDENHWQNQRALSEQIQALSVQLDQNLIRETELQKSLAAARQELQATRSVAESERQQALDKLAREQCRSDEARQHWLDQMTALEQQFVQQRQCIQMDLDRVREEAAGLRAEREAQLRRIDALEHEHQRLVADAGEVLLARKTQRRSVVKIARLTRALQRAWRQIESLRLRNHDLATQTESLRVELEEARTQLSEP